jgi:hypothetical protein
MYVQNVLAISIDIIHIRAFIRYYSTSEFVHLTSYLYPFTGFEFVKTINYILHDKEVLR